VWEILTRPKFNLEGIRDVLVEKFHNLFINISMVGSLSMPYRIVLQQTEENKLLFFWPKNGGCRVHFYG
tara:strand:+ start:276 stop:482 length:207 start_codon:yes stop_codon:yes gene_type:complete